MKTFLLLFALMLTAAQAAKIPEITTLRGKTYRRCEIVRVHPDGVSFTHADGAAKILFTDLPKSWRTRFGYDPEKAAAYETEVNERRKKITAARAREDAELSRNLAEAERLSRIRQLALAAQADAERQAVANTFVVPSYPILPVLGAVYDGRSYHQRGSRFAGLPYAAGGWYPCVGYSPGYGLGWGFYPTHFCLPPVVRRVVITP